MKRRLFISLLLLTASGVVTKAVRKPIKMPDTSLTKWIGQDGQGNYWWKYSEDGTLHPISKTQYACLADKIRYP
jgi:hypothetical protein